MSRRTIGFFIGALLGCGLVWMLLQSRPEMADKTPILRPWQGPLVFLEDFPPAEDGSWKRIRIIQDPGWHRLVRLEETLKNIEGRKGSQVIARKAMAADRVFIVPSREADLQAVELWLAAHGARVWQKSEGPWLVGLEGDGDLLGKFLSNAKDTKLLTAREETLPDPTTR